MKGLVQAHLIGATTPVPHEYMRPCCITDGNPSQLCNKQTDSLVNSSRSLPDATLFYNEVISSILQPA